MQSRRRRLTLMTSVVLMAVGSARAGTLYVETNLVSNGTVPAQQTDPNLVGAWGISFSTGSPLWVADEAANVNFPAGPSAVATLYSVPAASGGLTVSPPVPLATFGVMNNGNVSPERQPDQYPHGHREHLRPGNHDEPDDRFPDHRRRVTRQGRLSFSPISMARFPRGRAG